MRDQNRIAEWCMYISVWVCVDMCIEIDREGEGERVAVYMYQYMSVETDLRWSSGSRSGRAACRCP